MKNNKLKATIRTSEGYKTIEIDQITESMDIVKIGNKHMKPYVYVREFDFTNLSDADSMLYGIKQKIYKYVGVSTEQLFTRRISKWVYLNTHRNNNIGKLLNKIKYMLNDRLEPISLNEYIEKNSRILAYCDTIEQARKYEQSLIGVIQYEQDIINLDVECLNKLDKPLEINKNGYKLKPLKRFSEPGKAK